MILQKIQLGSEEVILGACCGRESEGQEENAWTELGLEVGRRGEG